MFPLKQNGVSFHLSLLSFCVLFLLTFHSTSVPAASFTSSCKTPASSTAVVNDITYSALLQQLAHPKVTDGSCYPLDPDTLNFYEFSLYWEVRDSSAIDVM